MHIYAINSYKLRTKDNSEQNISFSGKLDLNRYGDAGKKLKDLLENSVIGQRKSENTVLGLAMLGLAALGKAGMDLKDLRKDVSGDLAEIRHSAKLEDSKRKREEKENARREILQEMSDCGMTQAEIGSKLGLTRSGVSGQMRKYGIKTDFSKKYDTGITEIRYNSPVLQKAIDGHEDRKYYLEILKKYPNLNSKYKRLLVLSYRKPNDTENDRVLKNFEKIMEDLSVPEEIHLHDKYFEVLETKYINDFDNICKNYWNNEYSRGSNWKYFALLKGEKISSKELEEWTKYPEFNCDEFMSLRGFSDDDKKQFAKFKKEYGITNFDIFADNIKDDKYTFSLRCKSTTDLNGKLQAIAKMHEILYKEPPYFTQKYYKFEPIHVRDELFNMYKRDGDLNALYNLTKFLDFKELRGYSYTYEDVITLQRGTPAYIKLREDIGKALISFDMQDEKVQQLVDIMNREDLFKDIMDGAHSILRFISRFVLKNNSSPHNLEKETEDKVIQFKEILDKSLEENKKIKYFNVPGGSAPQFYISKNDLGYYILVTIGRDGKIHTIYEDSYKFERYEKMKRTNSYNKE